MLCRGDKRMCWATARGSGPAIRAQPITRTSGERVRRLDLVAANAIAASRRTPTAASSGRSPIAVCDCIAPELTEAARRPRRSSSSCRKRSESPVRGIDHQQPARDHACGDPRTIEGETAMRRLKVLIADDHELMVEAVRLALAESQD